MFSSIGLFLSGVPKKVWAGIAVFILLGGTVWYCSGQVEERVEQAEQKGVLVERTKGLEETIKNVEKADEAREAITAPTVGPNCVSYNQCLRTQRGDSKVCERFLRGSESSVCVN